MEKTDYGGQEKRRFFRLSYPPARRPTFKVRTHELEILEVSEKGLKFLNDKKIKLAEWVRGTITFHDGECLDVEGRTVRKEGDEIVLSLIAPVPFPRILKEQRFVISVS
jgi:hypothetical protein